MLLVVLRPDTSCYACKKMNFLLLFIFLCGILILKQVSEIFFQMIWKLLSDGGSLFNPRAVSKALMRGVCLNYWTETGPMNEIADCIEHNVGEVREDIVKFFLQW